MRLGIMLRHFDQHEGGVKVYTREIVHSMIELNRKHEIVLLFRNRQRLGTYRGVDGVQEVLLEGGPILYMGSDQGAARGGQARHRCPVQPQIFDSAAGEVQDFVGVSRHGLVRHATSVRHSSIG